MKAKVLSLVAMFLIGTLSVFAKDKTEKFLVNGNCDSCKKRIETAALAVKGVSKAEWDKKTKEISVTLDDSKTDVHKVQMAIANAGHDTQMHKANKEAYNKLPSCCQYDRTTLKASAAPATHEHQH